MHESLSLSVCLFVILKQFSESGNYFLSSEPIELKLEICGDQKLSVAIQGTFYASKYTHFSNLILLKMVKGF